MSEKKIIWSPTYGLNDYEMIDRSTTATGTSVQMHQLDFKYRQFDGEWSSALHYDYITRRDAVVVLIFHPPSSQLVLIEQFRLGPTRQNQHSPWMLECVAGLIDQGESARDTAIRESKEEAGVEVDKLRSVMTYYPSPGCFSEQIELFYAEAKALPEQQCYGLVEESEDIKVHLVHIDQVPTLLEEGQVINLNTICALQWLLLQNYSMLA